MKVGGACQSLLADDISRVGQNLGLLPSFFYFYSVSQILILGHSWCWGPGITRVEKGIQTKLFYRIIRLH